MEQEQKIDLIKSIPEICPDAKYRMEMLRKRYLPNKVQNNANKESKSKN